LLKVVYGEQADASDGNQLCLVNTFSPGADVVVSAYGRDRSESGKLFEDASVADVATVNDMVATVEERLGLRPEEAVRVGDEANSKHGPGLSAT
jgi:hypothetical protein